MLTTDDLQDTLADLCRRRALLDSAIANLEPLIAAQVYRPKRRGRPPGRKGSRMTVLPDRDRSREANG